MVGKIKRNNIQPRASHPFGPPLPPPSPTPPPQEPPPSPVHATTATPTYEHILEPNRWLDDLLLEKAIKTLKGKHGMQIVNSHLIPWIKGKTWTDSRKWFNPENSDAWQSYSAAIDIDTREPLCIPIHCKIGGSTTNNHWMMAARFANRETSNSGDWTFVLVDSFNTDSAMENAEETICLRSGLHLKRGAMDDPNPCSQNAKPSATFLHKPTVKQTEQECGFRMLLHIALAGSCTTPKQFTHTIDALEKISNLAHKCRHWTYSILINPQKAPALPAWITHPPENTVQQHQQHTRTVMYKEVHTLNGMEVLAAGLSYVGFSTARQKRVNLNCNVERFKSFYGIPPTTVAPVLLDLRADNPDLTYKLALMAMNWLFLYLPYPVLAGIWGYCEKFIGANVIGYAKKIQKLCEKKIKFQFKDDPEIPASIDTVNFLMQEFRLDPSSKHYNPKSNSCGVVRHILTMIMLILIPIL